MNTIFLFFFPWLQFKFNLTFICLDRYVRIARAFLSYKYIKTVSAITFNSADSVVAALIDVNRPIVCMPVNLAFYDQSCARIAYTAAVCIVRVAEEAYLWTEFLAGQNVSDGRKNQVLFPRQSKGFPRRRAFMG